jgi:hypothetical protein
MRCTHTTIAVLICRVPSMDRAAMGTVAHTRRVTADATTRIAKVTTRMKYEVILKRANGQYVKSRKFVTKYKAKQQKMTWEQTYDETYYVEIKNL